MQRRSVGAGHFRSGSVTIAGSNYLLPKTEELMRKFSNLMVSIECFEDIYDKAKHEFLMVARNQFFMM